uniref:Putative c2h2-type zn-finger protein n=1 Tax=Nyssomyia neivai TaxID=330878 RepID=A0A1L8DG97_9DIPT
MQIDQKDIKLKMEDPDEEMDAETVSDEDEWKPPTKREKKEYNSDSSDASESPKVQKKKRGRKRGPRKKTPPLESEKKPLLPAMNCYMCSKTYTTAYMLQKHLDEHYSNRGGIDSNHFPCKVRPCGKVFTTAKFLECHLKSHEIDKLYDCKTCSMSFSTTKILSIHRATHIREKRFNCELCTESFAYENNLIIHVEKHIEELPFSQELLDLHMLPVIDLNAKPKPGIRQELLTGGVLYNCSQCPMKFATFNDRRNHQNREHPKMMTCEQCGKVLRSPFGYRLHMVTHTKEKPFKCKQCGEGFSNPTLLVVHRRVAHGPGDDKAKRYRPHQCETCGKSYVFRYSLTEHINFKHGNVKLICDLCGHSYGTKARLKRHFKKVHLVEKIKGPGEEKVRMRKGKALKKPNCPECDFVAPRVKDLRDHRIKNHYNMLHCTDCNITMDNLYMYKQHLEDHKDGISVLEHPGSGRKGRIFGCLRCDKYYTDRRFLREHINARHNSTIFKCDHCEMSFQTKRALIRHLSHNHGIEEKEPKPRKVEGLKMKKMKKTKIKNFQPPTEMSSQSSYQFQQEPPQSSPLALHIPHQSPHTIPQGVQAHISPTSHELQQHFKVEPQMQYLHFGNI